MSDDSLLALSQRWSTQRIARRFSVRPATVSRWLRVGLPARRHDQVAAVEERSARAIRVHAEGKQKRVAREAAQITMRYATLKNAIRFAPDVIPERAVASSERALERLKARSTTEQYVRILWADLDELTLRRAQAIADLLSVSVRAVYTMFYYL